LVLAEPRLLLRQLPRSLPPSLSLLARVACDEVDVIGAACHHTDFFLNGLDAPSSVAMRLASAGSAAGARGLFHPFKPRHAGG